jgi:eukaryotic-like serine/threonine-protein kinase
MTADEELDQIVADFLRETERGRQPDPAAWIARHPSHASELSAFFADVGRFGSFLGIDSRTDPDATVDQRAAIEVKPAGRFGEYELLGEVGRGAMGVVYRARPAGTNLVVALKQLPEGGLVGADSTRRFREEVENASGLRHPHIVRIYHVGEQDGRPFYTMELIEGGSLDGRVNRYRDDPRAAAALVAKVARAVHYAHQRRLLHRDLKPGNILIDDAGEPHIADFGLATKLDQSGAVAGGVLAGSVPWMAPETLRGEPVTTAVDVWAIGVILYELLTGVRPFDGIDRSHIRQAIETTDPLPPRAIKPKISRDLEAICLKVLNKDPDKRYESGSALALDLERWLRNEPVRARRSSPPERLLKWSRRHPAAAGAAAFLALLIVVGMVSAFHMAHDMEVRVRDEVCRGNEFAAHHVASTVLGRLHEFGESVESTADDDALHRACAAGDWPAVERLLQQLTERRAGPNAPPFATAFVVDNTGIIRAEWPQRRLVVGIDVRNRDYFRGAVAKAGGSSRVHLSRVFTSKNDGLDKLSVSVPFYPKGKPGPAYVLGATIPTDSSLGLGGLHDDRRKVVLLAPRDTAVDGPPSEYVVLVHPGYTAREPSARFPVDRLRPGAAGFLADDDYADPVGINHTEYAGRWLAGFAPVPDTELVVLVQQPYEQSVAPYPAFFRRFLEWFAVAGTGAALIVVVIWLIRRRWSPKTIP